MTIEITNVYGVLVVMLILIYAYPKITKRLLKIGIIRLLKKWFIDK